MLNKITSPDKIDFSGKSNEEIISLMVQLEQELKKREIKFDVGEIGETIAIDFFNNKPGLGKLQRASRGTKDADAYSKKAERYTIKTIKSAIKTGAIYQDADNVTRQLFEYLLIVKLNEDYDLQGIYRFSWEQFLKVRLWDKRMTSWYVPISKKAIQQGEIIYEK